MINLLIPYQTKHSYAMSVGSQFMHPPGRGIMLSKNGHFKVDGYTDANWAGNIIDRQSTSGYFTFVESSLVTCCQQEAKGALSSAEAEYRGMAKEVCELL